MSMLTAISVVPIIRMQHVLRQLSCGIGGADPSAVACANSYIQWGEINIPAGDPSCVTFGLDQKCRW
jgi:hypothetical protein